MNKFFPILFGALFLPGILFAQTLHQDLQGLWRAEVLNIEKTETIVLPGTDVETTIQTFSAKLLEGSREGEVITFTNDHIQLTEGDKFYVNYLVTFEGEELYSVREVDRRLPMLILLALFMVTVLVFGGKQGLRSLLSVAASLFVIVYMLVPALASGAPPVPVSMGIAIAVLFFAIFFTHGMNRVSLVAFVGTVIAVMLTGFLAHASIHFTSLTGFSSDESVYLNLNTGGTLDFAGLLLAAIIIGALGVLDDIAVTQAAVVSELAKTGTRLKRWSIYRSALRVGKEHVGALVNTLVLAYTGAALPLLLLFSLSDSGALTILNREIFATEIVRTLVGSIGLILTVPITTFLAVLVITRRDEPQPRVHEDQVPPHD